MCVVGKRKGRKREGDGYVCDKEEKGKKEGGRWVCVWYSGTSNKGLFYTKCKYSSLKTRFSSLGTFQQKKKRTNSGYTDASE